jgi:hypothetical protein
MADCLETVHDSVQFRRAILLIEIPLQGSQICLAGGAIGGRKSGPGFPQGGKSRLPGNVAGSWLDYRIPESH